MEEKVLFEGNNVKVTTARFMVSAQTFAMSNITSVKTSAQYPNRVFPILLGLLGLLIMIGSMFGLLLLGGAIGWWLCQESTYHVVLTTAGGETKALSSDEKELISKVVDALNQAIVARG